MQVRTTRLQEEDKNYLSRNCRTRYYYNPPTPIKNALTANMWSQLAKIALQTLDNPKNKVLILRGSGKTLQQALI